MLIAVAKGGVGGRNNGMSSDNSSTADELALLMDLKLMPVCWPVALMTAERRGRIMF